MKKRRVNSRWLSIGMALVFSLSLLILIPGVSESSPKAPKVYVIGGMQGLSGPAYTPWIDELVKATELAVDEINKAGGIGGVPMKIVWEDHQAKGPVAVSAFNKLIDIDGVPVSTIGYTAPVMACAPIADARQVLLINHGAHGPIIAGAGKYLFHNMINQLVTTRALLYYAKKELGIKKLGLIYVNDTMGISMRDFLEKTCPKIGITLVGSTAFDVSATDFSAQIVKARAWKADAIYSSQHSAHYTLIKQAHEVGWDPQWLSVDIPVYGIFLEKAGPGINGTLGAESEASFERHPELLGWKKRWEGKFGAGTFPKTGVAPIVGAYDYPYIVKRLIEYGKQKGWSDYWTGKRLRQALVEIRSFRGLTGKFEFDLKTGLCDKGAEIIKMIPNPEKPGQYKWEEIKYYSLEEMVTIPR